MIRFKLFLENRFEKIIWLFSLAYSRFIARKYRRQVIRKNGIAIVNSKLKKDIKQYAKDRFGTASYWHYLALYTEIRGQFLEGWVPFDYYRYVMLPKVNPFIYSNIDNVKTLDYRLFGAFSIKPLFLHISGMFYSTDLKRIGTVELNKTLVEHNDLLVVKEEFGMGGKQIEIMHSTLFDPSKFKKKVNCVIQPYIIQYEILSKLHPESLNTFRVTTYINDKGLVDVKFVILRFGIDGSKVDNLSSGGNCIYFDAGGNPSEYAYDGLGFNMGNKHKNTGSLFSKIKIPMFSLMIDLCKDAHYRFPYIGIIGWDVCIDASGQPKLVEWNASSPSFWEYEAVFGPFWAKDNV